MANLKDILNKTAEDIEEPVALPPGDYEAIIAGPPSFREYKRDGETDPTQIATFTLSLVSALDGVDPDLLEAAKGLKRRDGKPKQVRLDFWCDEDNLYKLRNTVNSVLGKGNWESFGDAFERMAGETVTASVKHRTYTNKAGEQLTTADCAGFIGQQSGVSD